jgi:DNA-binding response OmpR family regulator
MRYIFDGYILDTLRYELSCRGQAIKLRPKVFEVLAYLIRHRVKGRTAGAAMAQAVHWGWDPECVPDGGAPGDWR